MKTVKFCGVELKIDPELKIRFLTCNPNGVIKGWSHKPIYSETIRAYIYDYRANGGYSSDVHVQHFTERARLDFQNPVAYPKGIIEELYNTVEAWDLTLDLRMDSKFLTMDLGGGVYEWNSEPHYVEELNEWFFKDNNPTDNWNYLEHHHDPDNYGPAKDRIIEVKNLQTFNSYEKPLADMIHGTASIKFSLWNNGDFDIHDLESIKQEILKRHCVDEIIEITGLCKK